MENIFLCWRCNYREQDPYTGLCSECKIMQRRDSMENILLCWRCNYREQDKSTGLCSECKNLISEKLLIHKCEEEFASLILKKSLSFEDETWFDVKVDGNIYGLNLTYDLERKCHVVFVYKTIVRNGYRTTCANKPIVGSFIPKEKLNYSFDN